MPYSHSLYNTLTYACRNFANDKRFDKREFVEIYSYLLSNGVVYGNVIGTKKPIEFLREKANDKLSESELDKLEELTQKAIISAKQTKLTTKGKEQENEDVKTK